MADTNRIGIKIIINKISLVIRDLVIKISAGKLINGGAPILIMAPINQNIAITGINFIIPLVNKSLRELEPS